MENRARGRLSQAFVHGTTKKGRSPRTAPSSEPAALGADLIDAKLPFIAWLCRDYCFIDPVNGVVRVRPVVLPRGWRSHHYQRRLTLPGYMPQVKQPA